MIASVATLKLYAIVFLSHMGSLLSKQQSISMEVQSRVESLIAENKVMVFSKSYCPFCHKAKAALGQFTTDYNVVEVRLDTTQRVPATISICTKLKGSELVFV